MPTIGSSLVSVRKSAELLYSYWRDLCHGLDLDISKILLYTLTPDFSLAESSSGHKYTFVFVVCVSVIGESHFISSADRLGISFWSASISGRCNMSI